MLSFLLNDKRINFSPAQADLTVLDYLRESKKLTGSKEGCASGDCGACTVVLAEVSQTSAGNGSNAAAKLYYRPINSCITFMSALQGKQLITVEHLANQDKLHPVQQSMVDHHGSQCGFCTPGFIMSMFALYHQDIAVNRTVVEHALSGNLCRCTGYRPIIDATLHACANKQVDHFNQNEQQTIEQLQSLVINDNSDTNLLTPTSRESLRVAIAAHPTAPLFAGSTDLALQVTQQLKQFSRLISLSKVTELNQLKVLENGLLIGAALPLSDIETSLLHYFPTLNELLSRFASHPVRNQASLGGNVANASPIGDLPPVLLALNATIELDNGLTRRSVKASEFFLDYRQTAMQQGEWIEGIYLPFLTANCHLQAYKISKRMEDDISAVCAVFNLTLNDNKVASLSCGFGGVAATPVSINLEALLKDKPWSDAATFELGKTLLSQSFEPIDDVRASKEYRQHMLISLWRRFWLQTNSQNQAIATRTITTRIGQLNTHKVEADHA
ncbi:xanthine dehydrogenase small subunit [Paraglaciecola sp.]|uniref:xanthine dehydrogenase small subunit n=1 Tax=Paraglaciecola sp. TaxID=1920173 RepID=UPI0030F44CFC